MSEMSRPSGRRAPWRLLLVVSLALNLFFLGAAVALVIHKSGRPGPMSAERNPADRSPAARIDRLAATLPPQDAKEVQAQFTAVEATVEAGRRASREAQEAVRRALKAEPFDPAAADTALNALRDARRSIWAALHGAVMKAAVNMSPEGRARLADWIPPDDPVRPKPASR
ncbi:periplasmic heavy metal sensor [Azorhizobium doebereinerae]|uniref:periplasmic heavy metal sensor n=1 Tax=Azorhizobium doebereinerae TaxID=281091 RepID=UPI000417007A|nr:periplasmic heavy metal sensor [Azorhizobium doebereinerae]